MGLYDELTMDRECSELGITRGDKFQTKSLYAAGACFTITHDGKLVEHQFRYEHTEKLIDDGLPWLVERIELGDMVIPYHGDLLVYRFSSRKSLEQFVVRFTHGCLEGVQRLEDYPELSCALLLEQGAR